MENFLFQKITVRKIRNFLNNILFFFVILNVVFYPLVFSASYSIASEEDPASEVEEEKEEAEEEESDESGEDEEVDSGEEEEIGSDEQSGGDAIEEDAEETGEKSDDASNQDLSKNVLPETSQNNEVLGTSEVSSDNSSETEDLESENRSSDFWRTCGLLGEENDKMESEEYEECCEKTDCNEIKTCIVEKIENVNDTEVENIVSSEANTGDNAISEDAGCEEENCSEEETGDSSGENGTEESDSEEEEEQIAESEAVIDTGDAVAESNVYNEVNVNIVSENYISEILNINGEYVGDIDLLEKFQELLEKALANGETVLIEVSNTNEADVENVVNTEADSGNNSIEGSESGVEATEAKIETGDSVAVSNLVNIVNLNIVGNNWVFSVANVFGKWIGNLIIPGAGLLTLPETSDGSVYYEVANENEADVENTVETTANTGNNSVSEIEGNSSVSSGEAVSGTQIENMVNTNITQNNWLFLIINNMGSWTGSIMGWHEDSLLGNIFRYDFDISKEDLGSDGLISSIIKIFNKNMASVSNSVSTNANTGGNEISGTETADISTGNAYAKSNILNFINTNITGNNWLFSMINIMGEWEGDVIFAYPDLKISISDGKNDANPGEELSYYVEYENVGQAACEDVEVYVGLPEYFSYKSNNIGSDHSSKSGIMVWNLDGMEPGEKRSFTVKGEISEEFPEDNTVLKAGAGITTSTKEVESGNNSSTDETKVSNYSGVNHVEYPEIDPEIKITRGVSPGSFVRQGNFVVYSILLENEGDTPVYDLVVEDKIKNETGDLGGYQWSVGDIGEGEKILIQYQVIIAGNAPLGMYTNQAVAYGEDAYGDDYKSGKAFTQIRVLGGLAHDNNQNSENIISVAQAAENPLVLGDMSGCSEWPFWIWMLVLMGYAGGVSIIIMQEFKSLTAKWGSIVVSAGGTFALWYFFERCHLYPLYPYIIFGIPIILYFIYFSWRKKTI